MKRVEFKEAVKRDAAERSQGRCECDRMTGEIRGMFPLECERAAAEFDHNTACVLGGDGSLENCAHLCNPCHTIKTATDQAYRAKRNRHAIRRDKAKSKSGAKMQSRGFCKRFKKNFDGSVELRT